MYINDYNKYVKIDGKYLSKDGSIKYILSLQDNYIIEAVYIPQKVDDIKLCISNQVGCINKCAYCATGTREYVRDMNSEEIVSQIQCILDNQNIHNVDTVKVGILFMGMGEPFFNFDNVINATKIISMDTDLPIPYKNIIVSTSGVIPRIIDFALQKPRPRLAVSINACDDLLRNRLMPINKVYPLKELLNACKLFQEITEGGIIFEYVLIKSINDSRDDLTKLVNIASQFNCEVQLIPYNKTINISFERPSNVSIEMFLNELSQHGIITTLKQSYGIDVFGGCGQLG